jgi:carboxypeptidase Q
MKRTPSSVACLFALALSAVGSMAAAAGDPWVAIVDGKERPVPAIEMGEESVVRAIIDEGKNRNKVMEHLRYLTQEIGPRLTGSSQAEAANRWAADQFKKWGLTNVHLDEWGTIGLRFDRGPSTGRVLLRDERQKNEDGTPKVEYKPIRDIQFSTLSWSKGTNGPARGRVFHAPKDEADLAKLKAEEGEHLKGAWILVAPESGVGEQRGVRRRLQVTYEQIAAANAAKATGDKLDELSPLQKLALEGVAGFVSTTRDERVWTGAVSGWREKKLEELPDQVCVVVRLSDYDCVNSRLADGEPVELEFDLKHTFTPGPIPVYNTVAEIRGTEKPDEVVIISGHLDSWDGPGSQGCTDNGTGSSVTLEAARILSTLGVKPKRTIRFILWTGEEQGLLGARSYVDRNKAEWEKISACFVDDGGTDYQGGLPAAEQMVEMLAAATAPVNNVFFSDVDKKFLNVNVRNTGKKIEVHGSSDHAAFNSVGIPGFFWDEEGRAEYSFGWHTQNDRFELGIPEYLVQSSTCSAVTAYRIACAPTLLPRVVQEEKEEKKE